MTDSSSPSPTARFFFYVLAFLGVALIFSAFLDWKSPVIKDLFPGSKPGITLDPFAVDRGGPSGSSFAFSRNNALWVSGASGSDATGTGAESNPFRTIQKGLNAMVDGQALAIRPGTYREALDMPTVGTSGKGLLVTGMGAGKTIVDITGTGTEHAVEFANGASHITLQNLSIRGGADSGRWSHGVYISKEGNNEHIILKNLDIDWNGQKDRGSGIFVFEQAAANLEVQNVKASGASDGIYLKGSNAIKVQNCTFYNNIEDGIDLNGGSEIFLLDNECYGNGDRGIAVHGNELPQSGGVLRGNNLHGNKDGIAFYLAAGTRVIDNRIEGNAAYGLRIAGKNLTIEKNYFSGNAEGHINENPNSVNITYSDNVLED